MSDANASPPASADTLIAVLKQNGLLDARREAAFRAVPRAVFLPDLPPETVYLDQAVPIKTDEDGTVLSSSSQPSMMAIMLRQLRLQPGMNVLEIGAGSGYNAALMQHLVGDNGKVTSIEIDAQIAEAARQNLQRASMGEVLVVDGDGSTGYAPRASYDRIIATAGIWDVPQAWVRQLKPRGLLVAPLWVDGFEVSAALMLQGDGSLFSEDNRLCGFLRLRGHAAGPEHSVRIGTSALYLYATDALDSTAVHLLLSDDAETTFINTRLSVLDYWQGFLPYLVLNVPEGFALARYYVTDDASAYGIAIGSGFALIGHGSACFVTVGEGSKASSFGGADALMAIEDALESWKQAGKPQQDRLRLRLVPKTDGQFSVERGSVYSRRDHLLLAWLEIGGKND